MAESQGVTGHVERITFCPGVNFTDLQVKIAGQNAVRTVVLSDPDAITWEGSPIAATDLVSRIAHDNCDVTLYPRTDLQFAASRADFRPYVEPQ